MQYETAFSFLFGGYGTILPILSVWGKNRLHIDHYMADASIMGPIRWEVPWS